MAKRKKLIISREGYILLAAIGVLLIALIVLAFATKCFGACGGKEELQENNTPSASVYYDTPTPSPTVDPTELVDEPNEPEDSPSDSDPAAHTPEPTVALSDDPNALTEPTEEMLAGAAQGSLTKSGVNMRQGPSTNTTILATGLKSGTKLTVYAEDGEFYFVQVNETKRYGYIAKKFIKLSSVLGETSDGSDQPEGTVLGTVTSSILAVREGPSVTSKALGQYNEGKKVYIYYKEGDYYYVLVAGTEVEGYMSAQFIQAGDTVPEKES